MCLYIHKRRWSSQHTNTHTHTRAFDDDVFQIEQQLSCGASHAHLLVNPHTQNTTIVSLTLHSCAVCGAASASVCLIFLMYSNCWARFSLRNWAKRKKKKRERPKIQRQRQEVTLIWVISLHRKPASLRNEIDVAKGFHAAFSFWKIGIILYPVDRKTFEAELYHSKYQPTTHTHTLRNAITLGIFHSQCRNKVRFIPRYTL